MSIRTDKDRNEGLVNIQRASVSRLVRISDPRVW